MADNVNGYRVAVTLPTLPTAWLAKDGYLCTGEQAAVMPLKRAERLANEWAQRHPGCVEIVGP